MRTLKMNKHIVIGVLLLLSVTLVLGWFVGRYVPGTPRDSRLGEMELYPDGKATFIPVSETVEVSLGNAIQIEGLVQGGKFLASRPEVCYEYDGRTGERSVKIEPWTSLIDSGPDGYLVEFPPFEARIDGARVVTLASFAEWYPDFIERGGARSEGFASSESKMVLVDLTVSNFSDKDSLSLQGFQLASDVLRQKAPGCLGNGYLSSYAALESLNGVARIEAGEHRDASLLTVQPGQTRSLTIPFHLSRYSFVDVDAFDDFDLGRFSLEMDDYGQGKVYRFALA